MNTTAAWRQSNRRRRGLLLAALLALSWVPLGWRSLAGAQGVPAGDAWAYERIARTFHETGRIDLVGWNDISFVGMLPVTRLWTLWFGFGSLQLHVLGAVAGFVALLAFVDVLGSLEVRDRLLPTIVFGGFAGFVGVTGTYLSDLFSLCGALWAIAVALRLAHPTRRPRATAATWLLVMTSACLAVYGFSVRQQAGAAAVVVLVLLWRSTQKRYSVVWLGVFVGLTLPFQLWRGTLANGGTTMLELLPRSAAASVIAWFFTVGLLAAPFAPALGNDRRSVPRSRRTSVAIFCVAGPIGLLASTLSSATRPLRRAPSIVTQLTEHGPVGWFAATLLACVAAWGWFRALDAMSTSGSSSLDRPLLVSVGVAGALEVVSIVATGAYFPRYSLVAGSLVVAWLALRTTGSSHERSPTRTIPERTIPARRHRAGAGYGIAGVLLGFSLWSLDVSVASARAVTEAGTILDCAGIDRSAVDGGFTWNGRYFTGIANARMDSRPAADGLPATLEQRVFFPMERVAVLRIGAKPDDDVGVTLGPLSSRGVLPFDRETVWITTTQRRAAAVRQCLELKTQWPARTSR